MSYLSFYFASFIWDLPLCEAVVTFCFCLFVSSKLYRSYEWTQRHLANALTFLPFIIAWVAFFTSIYFLQFHNPCCACSSMGIMCRPAKFRKSQVIKGCRYGFFSKSPIHEQIASRLGFFFKKKTKKKQECHQVFHFASVKPHCM